ncbi:hypothetical protein PIROE2DRAFT_16991 [Piromyces sp. E2]|nr:hypothetical protein PIROE2DRAFT_16991 [Piromyces sp. E2]|eukprot:OUM57879.1 hypothetical protein PIROE2DRAFT_16991 [Piromyces sp. E2]
MKLFFSLFVLINFIFSYVNCTNFSDVLKNEINIDTEKLNGSLSNECIEEEKNSEYKICTPEINLSNYKQSCTNIKSEKCQKFYSEPDISKYYPICSKNPLYNEYLQPIMMKTIKQQLEIICLTDENGDICPFPLAVIQQNGSKLTIRDNCKSKKCTESLIENYKNWNIDQYAAYENLTTSNEKFSYNQLNSIKYFIELLESDECKSLQQQYNNGSIHVNINNILLIILSLVLLLIFN